MRRDDVLEIDVRLTLETDDQQQIYMTWKAIQQMPAVEHQSQNSRCVISARSTVLTMAHDRSRAASRDDRSKAEPAIGTRGSVRPEGIESDHQAWEEGRRPRAVFSASGETVRASFGEVDLDDMSVRVRDPVLGHGRTSVKVQLSAAVDGGGAGGEDLDHQIRRAMDGGFSNDVPAALSDEHDVGLYDLRRGQHDVDGRGQRLSQVASIGVGFQGGI